MTESSRGVPENPELYAQFVADALEAYAEVMETGLAYDTADVRNYLRQRLSDPHAIRPQPKPWRDQG